MPICRAIGALILLIALSSTLHAQELSQEKDFNIPPQSLAKAVIQFSDQSGIQVVTAGQDVSKLTTEGVKGRLKIRDALKTLLNGTHLGYSAVGSSTVALVSLASSANVSEVTSGSQSASDQGSPGSEKPALTEIIVTAQKKSERVQDVPVPVSVVNTKALTDTSQVLLRDYYSSVPGLSVAPNAQGEDILSIRGITLAVGSATVGILVDDVPFGTPSGIAGNSPPDIDPGDLSHIEVLRGPQGTLYGASNLGGLIKYVTLDPSTESYSGSLQAGVSDIYNGAERGYNLRGSINIPVGDTLAVRASAFERQDPGYLDNPIRNLTGLNETQVDGARLSALWQPMDVVSLKLGAIYQHSSSNGSSDVDVLPGLGDLQQNLLPATGGYERTVQAYSATLKAKLSGVDFTSLTGYNISHFISSEDFTSLYAFFPQQQCSNGVAVYCNAATPFDYEGQDTKVTQELRFSGHLWQNFDWLAGAFYAHDNVGVNDNASAGDPSTGKILAEGVDFHFTNLSTEYAGFLDLTYHFSDRFNLQIGGREGTIEQTSTLTASGPYVNPLGFYGVPSPFIQPVEESRSNTFTYLITPQFKLTPDLMLYARVASGFRAGGPNLYVPGEPSQFKPDTTKNYEVGLKGDFLDHTLAVDGSVYYIDWKNIQLQFLKGSLAYGANGGTAKSEGVELSVESKPLSGLTIAAWVDYDDAALTQDFPSAAVAAGEYGLAGERLPFSSLFSGNVSVDQNFRLWNNAIGFVGASASFVGNRLGTFQAKGTDRQEYPSYTTTSLRAGMKEDSWTVTAYANNVADVRGVLNGGTGYLPTYAFQYITPRTIGINVRKEF